MCLKTTSKLAIKRHKKESDCRVNHNTTHFIANKTYNLPKHNNKLTANQPINIQSEINEIADFASFKLNNTVVFPFHQKV